MSYGLGFDVGCTNIKAVAVAPDGSGLERRSRPTPEGSDALAAAVAELVAAWSASHGEEPTWVGVSAPGLAGREGRAIVWMEGRNEGVVGLDWTAALGRPVKVLNDGHAATLGEAWLGAAAGHDNVLLLTLGTGVGGGVLVDGRLLRGQMGRAGHVGHLCLDPDGEPDICRTPGSLESAIGDVTLEARSGGRFLATEDLVQAAAAGDAAAQEIWAHSIHALACGLASLINVVDPELVVLGGGITKASDRLFVPLRAELDRVEWRPTGEAVPVVPAALGEYAGAIGAVRFAMQESGRDQAAGPER